MSQVHYLSQEGLENLKKELAEAIAERPVIAAAIAEAYPAEAVETACRYVRYAEQYLVVTSISSRALAAAGRAELEAIGRLTGGGRLI